MSPRGKKRDGAIVKTTVELPTGLWQAAKMRAVEERSDLKAIIVSALEHYLAKRSSKREG